MLAEYLLADLLPSVVLAHGAGLGDPVDRDIDKGNHRNQLRRHVLDAKRTQLAEQRVGRVRLGPIREALLH